MHRRFQAVFTAALIAIFVGGCASGDDHSNSKHDNDSKDKSVHLFNGKDTSGWKLVDPNMKEAWEVRSAVGLDPDDNRDFLSTPGTGVMVLAHDHGTDIFTDREFGDCKLHIEFMIPKGSNSGVYLMGRYEIQILDSFGKPDSELKANDCGGMYRIVAPRTNALKAPGEWQSYDIIFRAPRFDSAGKKTENARLVNVTFNGTKIHDNVDIPHATAGGIAEDEKPAGPILLQGNHGLVAFRNIKITPMEIK